MDSRSDGCFFSTTQTEATHFNCISDLVFKVDQCCNQMDMPQASMEMRRFGIKKPPTRRRQKKKTEAVQNPAMLPIKGNAATFVVSVLFRQNASWQGTIQWCDGREKLQFRSVLELLYIMNSAIELNTNNIRKKPASTDAPALQGIG